MKLAVRVRYPAWAGQNGQGLTISVNGHPVPVGAAPGSYAVVERQWANGDVVSLHIPLALRIEAMADDPAKVAIFYGPLILGGRLGTDGLHAPMPYARDQLMYAKVPDGPVPTLATGGRPVDQWLKPVPGQPLTFQTQGVGRPADVTLVPFYQQHRERYTVYWDLDASSPATN